MNKPLLSSTTGNRILVAALAAILTALLGWITSSVLQTKSEYSMLSDEQEWMKSWMRENESDLGYNNQRIDILMEMITREILIDEVRNSSEKLNNAND